MLPKREYKSKPVSHGLAFIRIFHNIRRESAMNPSVPVRVNIDASKWIGTLEHNWNYIGYDECNYTHSPGGMELISKFGKLEKPYYIRAHHMLCTGNLHGAYKWGSTNAYTEDAAGNPVYSFEVIDTMCDIWLGSNCKPFFEIGFMPMALADMPEKEASFNDYKRNGWNRPPKDYEKWYDLIHALLSHLVERYGEAELQTWYFEMWNEPDIVYWQGTHEEFCKLYDYTEAAIHDVMPSARFGGPATCGAMETDSKAANYLRDFLKHTRSGINYKTGAIGTRLDFTSFHTKGGGYGFTTSKALDKTPSVKKLLDQVRIGGNIIKEYGYGHLECILSEADPDGWAAGGRYDNPAFDFRNTEYYASYVASAYKNIFDIGEEMGLDFRPLAWAFLFEGERCFEGTRSFSTQGIDKAVFNTFKLYAKLGRQRLELTSSHGRSPEGYEDFWGEGKGAEISGWATLTGTKSVEVLLYCHEDTWDTESSCEIHFTAENLSFEGPYKVTHYRIDKNHSNAYSEWVRQGRPDYPSGCQFDAIKARDGLELLCPIETVKPLDGKLKLKFDMPVKSVSLLIITRE
jgi:xylan 1,4-beta-xylosidase